MPARLTLAALGLVSVLAAAAPAYDEPLEPERAFPLSARARVESGPPRIELRFAVADGHYLYADRFRVEAPGLSAGTLQVPPALEKDDAFVGRTRILKGDVVLVLPLARRPASGEHAIHVTAQGCAEQRFCYAPFTQTARVRMP